MFTKSTLRNVTRRLPLFNQSAIKNSRTQTPSRSTTATISSPLLQMSQSCLLPKMKGTNATLDHASNGVYNINPFIDIKRHFSSQIQLTPLPGKDIMHSRDMMGFIFPPDQLEKWNHFVGTGTAFVIHEGHCANTHISELKALGFKHIVLVSKAEECAAEHRVSDVIEISDFNDVAANYDAIAKHCESNRIKDAIVFVGWGYSSESKQVPIESQRICDRLPHCRFITPCNSVKTLDAIAEKDDFDRTVAALKLPAIPNYGVTFGIPFDDRPENVFRFVDRLFETYMGKETVTIYFKHPSCGGGRGIVPIAFSRDYQTDSDSKITEINQAISQCHKEGEAFLEQGQRRPIVLQMGIENAYHIEGQCVGKSVIALRECSAQERGQKKAEGTVPQAILDDQSRQLLLNDIETFAKANQLNGPNTVEILAFQTPDPDMGTAQWNWVFLEDNTRLQVEHLVTSAELGVSVIGLIVADSIGLNIEPLLANASSHAVRHIRLTGIDQGHAEILTSQDDMQQKMNDHFGDDVVKVRLKQRSEIDPSADQQFGALVITTQNESPMLAKDVLSFFEANFLSTGLAVPYRIIYSVLERYITGHYLKVGESIEPSPPSSTEKEYAMVMNVLNRRLNHQLFQGESPLNIPVHSILQRLDTKIKAFVSKYPVVDHIKQLKALGWREFWLKQAKVGLSYEDRDYQQSYMSHITHPYVTKNSRILADRMGNEVVSHEAAGVSGSGPQVSAVVHGMDPSSNRYSSKIIVNGLERGPYMNSLSLMSDRNRAAMKYTSNKIETATYGTCEYNGQEFGIYMIKNFYSPNNTQILVKMYIEDCVYGRLTLPTLCVYPGQTEQEIRTFYRNLWTGIFKYQQNHPEANIPNPPGAYIKIPSPTVEVGYELIHMSINCCEEEYKAVFHEDITLIDIHQHNSGRHATDIAKRLKTTLQNTPSHTRYMMAATFEVGDVPSSHPNILELVSDNQRSLFQDAQSIKEDMHQLQAAHDKSKLMVAVSPQSVMPGGMGASALRDLNEIKARYSDNQAFQSLLHYQAHDVGLEAFGMQCSVTPTSQFNFLAGAEIFRNYPVLNADQKPDISASVAAFEHDLQNGQLICNFPDPLIEGMRTHHSDFPNPKQHNIDTCLELIGVEPKYSLPDLYLTYSEADFLQDKRRFESILGFELTDEDVLTALRFGTDCNYLTQKAIHGAGLDTLPVHEFFGQKSVHVGDTIGAWTVSTIEPKGLNTIIGLDSSDHNKMVVTVPNHQAVGEWVREQMSGTPKYDKSIPFSYPFDSLINAEITDILPKDSIISKKEDGTITVKDSEGNPLAPLDSNNPTTFCQTIIMKMSVAQSIPKDLIPGDYQFVASPYLHSSAQSKTKVHAGTKGFEACRFERIGQTRSLSTTFRRAFNHARNHMSPHTKIDLRYRGVTYRVEQMTDHPLDFNINVRSRLDSDVDVPLFIV